MHTHAHDSKKIASNVTKQAAPVIFSRIFSSRVKIRLKDVNTQCDSEELANLKISASNTEKAIRLPTYLCEELHRSSGSISVEHLRGLGLIQAAGLAVSLIRVRPPRLTLLWDGNAVGHPKCLCFFLLASYVSAQRLQPRHLWMLCLQSKVRKVATLFRFTGCHRGIDYTLLGGQLNKGKSAKAILFYFMNFIMKAFKLSCHCR